MNNYAVLVTTYPDEKNPATVGFVHSRVKEYIKHGINVEVLRISNVNRTYEFDGVKVIENNSDELYKVAQKNKYSKILVHFLCPEMDRIIKDFPVIAWVHGVEALHWKRRLFNISLSFPKYIITNNKQLKYFRSVVQTKKDITFVFVSEWMKDIAVADLKTSISNYSIIPNYINGDEFKYTPKTDDQKNNILIIRSFASKKYANDISVKIIKELSKKEYFKKLKFTIYGKGKLFQKTLAPIMNYSNVEVNNRFVQHNEISELHKSHGIFLCPTRQDAQGVSMCEAMCSGCVPITSNNTAIPEFLDSNCGFLCDNKDINSFVQAFDSLQSSQILCDMSKNTSSMIRERCGYKNTIEKEISLIIS